MFTLILLFALSYAEDATLKENYDRYFRAVVYVPKTCTLKTEPGVASFLNGKYENYPLLLKIGSNKTAIAFYDITGQLIEEINIEGFKKTQIENLLDRRGFFIEDVKAFKANEIDDKDFAFKEIIN
ncbi:hypothetical protein EIN_057720 [Entamoeba invadens IP1]|uniref:hypothetical protein n=1 Tax=Entamoeba invadens IP1 TaxID=370355 RepID=UPI0002C3E20D|nr:hypothetical protein EIN_057720 [Entamoeba invadens IP1]ELP93367.1 hypothetical protein EIN_057720 [Entamoeba invadens IP1]|eukprot:XP_004260138.1 hypothetical protein EIN_057720 [Entamoeba invadens IP1]